MTRHESEIFAGIVGYSDEEFNEATPSITAERSRSAVGLRHESVHPRNRRSPCGQLELSGRVGLQPLFRPSQGERSIAAGNSWKIKMSRRLRTLLIIAVFIASTRRPALAQSFEFLPEIDAHLKLNSFLRTYLQAKDTRDAGASNQLEIGPSLQLYLKPLVKLKHSTTFDPDDSKPRVSVFEIGYRSVTAPNALPINRMEPVVTFHYPLIAGFLISDRNRADLDWTSQSFTWRYRNKLTIERTIAVGPYHLIPYVAAEPYYEEKYHKWSTTDLYAGSLFPVGKHVQFNAYFEHENNTGKHPNQQNNDFGFALYLFFSLEGKK
jgi:hypothetical protein